MRLKFDSVVYNVCRKLDNRGNVKLTMIGTRYKVTIRCNLCGERFILKGKREKGKIETGFKQCICGNDDDLDIRFEEM